MVERSKVYLSPDEIVSYLKRTSQATVLVEGSDEQRIYRYMEDQLSDFDLNFMVCNGREALLNVFNRRFEFSKSQVIFLADKDMWYFTGIPKEFEKDIIFTNGYSIENDLYNPAIFEGLMSREEKRLFDSIVSELARWQAFHVEEFFRNGCCNCNHNVSAIIYNDILSQDHLALIGFKEPSDSFINLISTKYQEALRGKNLFQLLVKILSSSHRKSKYSRENLLEMGAKFPGASMDNLCSTIKRSIWWQQT